MVAMVVGWLGLVFWRGSDNDSDCDTVPGVCGHAVARRSALAFSMTAACQDGRR